MQCNRNPIEFEFGWRVAVGEMGTRSLYAGNGVQSWAQKLSLADERREASAQFFPQQSSVVRAGQRSSRPGMGKQETTMAIGHATAKYGNYGQERSSMGN